MSWKISMKPDDNEPEIDDGMEDLIMWYRIGHFMVSIGVGAFIIAGFVLIVASFVHKMALPDYTIKLCIALAIIGIVAVIGGKLTVRNVTRDWRWR